MAEHILFSAMDARLTAQLEQHQQHFSVLDTGKICCDLNGHTMPPKLEVVLAFIKGTKYQRLKMKHDAEHVLEAYEPFIVQSKNFPTMLYCALTGQLIGTSLEAVKVHMRGKKFELAKQRFTNDQQGLKLEPTLESFGVRVPKSKRRQREAEEEEHAEEEQEDAEMAAGGNEQVVEGKGRKQRQRQQQEEESKGDEGPGLWVPEGEEGNSMEVDEEAGAPSDDSESDGLGPGATSSSGGEEDDSSDDDKMTSMEFDEDNAVRAPLSSGWQGTKQQQQQQAGSKAGKAGSAGTGRTKAAGRGTAAAPGTEQQQKTMRQSKQVVANGGAAGAGVKGKGRHVSKAAGAIAAGAKAAGGKQPRGATGGKTGPAKKKPKAR